MTNGILAYGVYIPRRRLQRHVIHAANSWFAPNLRGLSKGEKAVSNWDEDAITMAVDAGRHCLDTISADIESVSLASTTLPFADRSNSGIVKEAMNLSDNIQALDVTGTLRCATSQLIQALQGTTTQLALSADKRKGRPGSEDEMIQGDGAAALLIGSDKPIATVRGLYSETIDFLDHFRANGEDFDYHWEKRWVRDEGFQGVLKDAINKGLDGFGVAPDAVDHVVLPLPGKSLPPKLVNMIGFKPEAVANICHETIGHTGAAHPILLLASVLDKAKPGETILIVGFGQGADVLLLEVTDEIKAYRQTAFFQAQLDNRSEDQNYMRYLFHRGLLNMEKGMRAEYDDKQPGTVLSRNRKAVLGLIGGRCSKTGTIQFPKTDISVNQNDRAVHTQEDYPLANKTAKVTTFTADRLTFSLDPPTFYGMIDFEGGGRMVAEFSDVSEADVEVGRDMRMVFRVKARDDQRKFVKYFWKATPVR